MSGSLRAARTRSRSLGLLDFSIIHSIRRPSVLRVEMVSDFASGRPPTQLWPYPHTPETARILHAPSEYPQPGGRRTWSRSAYLCRRHQGAPLSCLRPGLPFQAVKLLDHAQPDLV